MSNDHFGKKTDHPVNKTKPVKTSFKFTVTIGIPEQSGIQMIDFCQMVRAEIHQALLSQFSLLEEFLIRKLPNENR